MTRICFEDVEVGVARSTGEYRVSREEIIEFACRWDPQPFHLDKDASAESIFAGLTACFAHVFAIQSRLANRQEDELALLAGPGFEEAIEAFEAALRANPQSRIALANLGAQHFNEGRVDRAFVLYQRALAVDPDYALVHRQIASIHALRDEPRLAAHHLRRSLELDPEQADAGELRAQLARAEAAAAQRVAPAEGVDPTP